MKKHITGCQCQVFLFLRVGWQALLHGATSPGRVQVPAAQWDLHFLARNRRLCRWKFSVPSRLHLSDGPSETQWWRERCSWTFPQQDSMVGANASLLPLGCCCNEPGVLRPQARGDEACANPSPRFSVRPTSICPPTGDILDCESVSIGRSPGSEVSTDQLLQVWDEGKLTWHWIFIQWSSWWSAAFAFAQTQVTSDQWDGSNEVGIVRQEDWAWKHPENFG